MNRYKFKLTLLSDVILHAKSATEGNQETLDFIPGSNFLGIVASNGNYKILLDENKAYDIFHSGKVRFGDAHISKNDEKSFKAPLSWFFKKGESIENKMWIHHALNEKLRNNLVSEGIQIKQARSGWFTKNNKILEINSNYSLKSAYDRKTRSSKAGAMFGFKSFEAGSEWIFYVDIDEEIDPEIVKNKLIGKKYIGKSRSAQYGEVKIEKSENDFISQSTNKNFVDDNNNEYLVIYAESRLAFFNDFGSPTLQPTANDFKLNENWELDWSKTQVKSQVFAPYVFINRSFHTDRVCFTKGSVFVFKKKNEKADFDLKKIENGIGEYQNEGFGQVIVNPMFLQSKNNALATLKLIKKDNDKKNEKEVEKIDKPKTLVEHWLNNQIDSYSRERNLYNSVVEFVREHAEKYKKITASQWGQIRALSTQASNYKELENSLFQKVKANSEEERVLSKDRANSGFLEHGKIADKWSGALKKILKEELDANKNFGTEYCVRLATQMQKVAKEIEKKNKKEKEND